MALTGVTHVNQGIDDNLKLSYKELSESLKKSNSRNISESGVDLEKAVNPVEISETGRQILETSEKLEKIEDPEKRRQALEGMQKTVEHFDNKGDTSKLFDFHTSISKMTEEDPDMLEESFRTANILSDRGYDMDRWVDAYLRIENMDLQKVFMEETQHIVETSEVDENQKQETFDRFVGTTKALHEAGLDETEVQSRTEELLEQVTEQADFEAKNETMDRFLGEITTY